MDNIWLDYPDNCCQRCFTKVNIKDEPDHKCAKHLAAHVQIGIRESENLATTTRDGTHRIPCHVISSKIFAI